MKAMLYGRKKKFFLVNEIYFHAKKIHCSCHPTWLPWKPTISTHAFIELTFSTSRFLFFSFYYYFSVIPTRVRTEELVMFSMWGPDQPASALLPGKVPRAPNHVSTHWGGGRGGGILNFIFCPSLAQEFLFVAYSCVYEFLFLLFCFA